MQELSLAILSNEVNETDKDSEESHHIDVPVLPEESSHSGKDGGKHGPTQYLRGRNEEEVTGMSKSKPLKHVNR